MWGDRYAVLASGAGSNLQALIESKIPKPTIVIADLECGALERARTVNIPAQLVPFAGDRGAFTATILDLAKSYGVGTLVLAGFMRILGPAASQSLPNRIVNIHPSLLPAFPGRDAVGQALTAGVKITGVTVHFVDEFVDHGPIIAQQAVPVFVDDTVESLHARIQKEEHQLYPRVVKALLEGRLVVNDRRVTWT
ncbi:MAG TPA: phosphoribosylglycinamide formyltransferase [Acidimicrobiia bacterium]|jgi:phosphoribosylglycinamide formyltransferase 1|nr:phosphoribosylglycinamide formyltransferase [Acidimicrobiia bacterium]